MVAHVFFEHAFPETFACCFLAAFGISPDEQAQTPKVLSGFNPVAMQYRSTDNYLKKAYNTPIINTNSTDNTIVFVRIMRNFSGLRKGPGDVQFVQYYNLWGIMSILE
jgi:hypothetical protein